MWICRDVWWCHVTEVSVGLVTSVRWSSPAHACLTLCPVHRLLCRLSQPGCSSVVLPLVLNSVWVQARLFLVDFFGSIMLTEEDYSEMTDFLCKATTRPDLGINHRGYYLLWSTCLPIWSLYFHSLQRYENGYKMWKIGCFGVVTGHPRSLKIAPFDRTHMSSG